ncbi:MAG: SUMF1/EgtB/PvdO family nonheme iron enzyme [Kofleriaceae bacterium]
MLPIWRPATALAALAALTTACADRSAAPPTLPTPLDADSGPHMVVIPAGSFVMGSPDDELGRYKTEGPRRRLTIARFAMAAHEITRAQYATFVAETRRPDPPGCKTMGDGTRSEATWDPAASWRRPGFDQAANHPAVCLSWQDATDYAAWLARRTGRGYRLPSEAEWEYAARAGSTTTYFWGDRSDLGCAYANSGDTSLVRAVPRWPEAIADAIREGEQGAELVACDDGAGFTTAVGSYRPNRFGLYDMLGNAWEWVADCARPALPEDSRPYTDATCAMHRARGGSWNDYPRDFRSARRSAATPDDRWNANGIRLALSLEPGPSTR